MSQLAREVVLGQSAQATDFTAAAGSPAGRLSFQERPSRSHSLASDDGREPLIPEDGVHVTITTDLSPAQAEQFSRRVRVGINASWTVNVLLLVSKVAVFFLSRSYAVLASAIDSLVDLLSQAVLAVAEHQAAKFDARYPIGRTRVAELSVLACAGIMFVSTALVMREAVAGLWEGLHGQPPPLDVGITLFAVLGAASAAKLALYGYCRALRKNPIMVALAEDHLNDVMSNVAAVVGAAVAGSLPRYWWADPAVALLFAGLITRNWLAICWEQGQKMVGLEAPGEVVREVTHATEAHHPDMRCDRVTAYHHGSHVVVEVEVVMPARMTVRDSHDIALALQHKIEAMEGVERAFVHVDYTRRSVEEHKVERNLKQGERDVMKPLDCARTPAGSFSAPPAAAAAARSSPGGAPA